MAGARTMSGWLSSCRAMVGDGLYVSSAEVWGDSRLLEAEEQVQM